MKRAVRAVLLDRDGVINEDSPEYIKSAAEWVPIEGSLAAIARLSTAGIPVGVCTNQAGIARGKFTHADLAEMHQKMFQALAAESGACSIVRYSAHHPDAGSRCRKPKPGMLIDVARCLGVPLSACWFVGDSYKDLLAAQAAGCQPVLVQTGNGERTLADGGLPEGTLIFNNLAHAVEELLRSA